MILLNIEGLNKNIFVTVSYSKYKDFLQNKKCFRHSMNLVQSKIHKIGTHKIRKISLYCFHDKIYFLHNGFDLTTFNVNSLNT